MRAYPYPMAWVLGLCACHAGPAQEVAASAPGATTPASAASAPTPASAGLPPGACADVQRRDESVQGTALWGVVPASRGGAAPLFLHVQAAGGVQVGPAGHDLVRPSVPTLLRGVSADGARVDLALCAARVGRDKSGAPVELYRVEYRDPQSGSWWNVCTPARAAAQDGQGAWALALAGTWDQTGARVDAAGGFTLACESGVLAKCVMSWGYAPWASRDGQSLRPYHQACTRMARADYCGDGQTHTREQTLIDVYDGIGVERPTRDAKLSFEAAWDEDGATCIARTRYGGDLPQVQRECPGVFAPAAHDLGGGDVCQHRRVKSPRAADAAKAPQAPRIELRNRS